MTPSTATPSGTFERPTPTRAVRVDPPLICVRNLTVRYGNRTALADVSLPIYPGRITAVIGPSGCGKTTFLSAINRLTDLVPRCRVTGTIELAAKHRNTLDPNTDLIALRRRIGMIFQKPNPFPLSIRRNIELPLREHGMRDRDQLHHHVEASLKDVGLWDDVADRLNTSALALSGGQQQRLCIARALALKPRVILFDEPCSSLDPIASGTVEDLITSLRPRYTVVIVTHNLAQARRIADDAAFFWVQDGAGRLVEHAPAEQLFNNPRDPLTTAYTSGLRG